MTNIAEDLEKIIESMIENINENKFPIQERSIFRDRYVEKDLCSALVLCQTILSRHFDYDVEASILVQEDYEALRNYFQMQKNLIAVELQEIVKVLYKKERKLDRVDRLRVLLINNAQLEKNNIAKRNERGYENTKEEFDHPDFQSEWMAYNEWLNKNIFVKESLPLTYSISHDLGYNEYFHIASMAQEKSRVKQQNMTPKMFAEAQMLPEDITLITEFLRKKYLKKLSTVQLQKEYATLKRALIQCVNMRNLKNGEFTEEIQKYWDAMNCLENEQQRRIEIAQKSRYICLK